MRLVCPNCGAIYEIDSALLPEAGRDVQCSACGHTWFQRRETPEDKLADEMEATAPADPDPVEDDIDEDEDEEEAPAVTPRPVRRPDEAALAILREEAEREAAARRREVAGLETQAELGLTGVAATRALPDVEPDTPEPVSEAPAPQPRPEPARPHDSRSVVFPDIEEINSSLSAAESEAMARREAEAKAEEEKSSRRGFRIGFLSVVVLTALLIVFYAFGPRLAEAFPQAQPLVSDYLDWVNGIRARLEVVMQSAVERIDRD